MDLVYPDDQALVMSMWNKLAQGKSVTFEMRWKARPGTNNAAQWVLSACVPVFDDEKQLIGIAGNTIDINAQKKSQEAAQAQVYVLIYPAHNKLMLSSYLGKHSHKRV
jgi:PAS domain-containing protein